jgi:hypothetical protein
MLGEHRYTSINRLFVIWLIHIYYLIYYAILVIWRYAKKRAQEMSPAPVS